MSAPLQSYRVCDWFALNGDQTLRLDYDLTPDSVVLDVGGFEGEFAGAIYERYGCQIYIFEMHPLYLSILAEKFHDNPKIKIIPYGLSDHTGIEAFSSAGDATSAFHSGDHIFPGELKSADEAFAELEIKNVDLLKLNIEGSEYGVIDRLAQAGLIPSIKNIQVQFHDFFDDAPARMQAARDILVKTHAPTYMFSFVWENWKRVENDIDADARRNLFLSIDHIRERLSKRERQIDQMEDDAAEMRKKIERLSSLIEGNTIELQNLRVQTKAIRFLSTFPERIKRRFKP